MVKQQTLEEAVKDIASLLGLSLSEPIPAKASVDGSLVEVRTAFLKQLYDYAPDDIRQGFEKELPLLFGRPTFSIGERIKLFGGADGYDGALELLIIGTTSDTATGHKRIAVVNLNNGEIRSETVAVKDPHHITEQELFEAGRGFGITRSNYAKHE